MNYCSLRKLFLLEFAMGRSKFEKKSSFSRRKNIRDEQYQGKRKVVATPRPSPVQSRHVTESSSPESFILIQDEDLAAWKHVKDIFSQYLKSSEGKMILRYDPCHLITDKYTLAVVSVYLERLNDLQWLTEAFFTPERVLALLWFANTAYDDGVNNILLEEIAEMKFSVSKLQLSRIRNGLWRDLDFRLHVIPERIERTVDELQKYDVFNNNRARHHAGSKRAKDEQEVVDEWFDNPQSRCKTCNSATIYDILSDPGLEPKPPMPQKYNVRDADFSDWFQSD